MFGKEGSSSLQQLYHVLLYLCNNSGMYCCVRTIYQPIAPWLIIVTVQDSVPPLLSQRIRYLTIFLNTVKALQNISLHGNPVSMDQFQQMEGFQKFEARRKKFEKQIDSNVMIGSKGLDEDVDL